MEQRKISFLLQHENQQNATDCYKAVQIALEKEHRNEDFNADYNNLLNSRERSIQKSKQIAPVVERENYLNLFILKLENDLAEKYNTSIVPKITEFIQTVHRDMKALPVLDDRFQRELD